MIPHKIHLEVVTPERRVVEMEVDSVILPGTEGSFGVLPGHAPMLAGLASGVAECKSGSEHEVLAISAGFCEVTGDRVTVMAETCEKQSEIDAERARAKVEELEQEIEKPEIDVDIIRVRMLKHLARLDALKR